MSTTSWPRWETFAMRKRDILDSSKLWICIQVGIRIRCMSQAQYMAVRPCYLFMAKKDNGNLCNGGSNFRIESDISPCCILSKYDIWSQGVHVGSEMLLISSDGDELSSNELLKFPSGSTTVYCPINIHNRHWILLVLRCVTNKIEVYDPRAMITQMLSQVPDIFGRSNVAGILP